MPGNFPMPSFEHNETKNSCSKILKLVLNHIGKLWRDDLNQQEEIEESNLLPIN